MKKPKSKNTERGKKGFILEMNEVKKLLKCEYHPKRNATCVCEICRAYYCDDCRMRMIDDVCDCVVPTIKDL